MQRIPELPFFIRWFTDTEDWPGTGPVTPKFFSWLSKLPLMGRLVGWGMENENESQIARLLSFGGVVVYSGWYLAATAIGLTWYGFCLALERCGLGWLWQRSKFKFRDKIVRRPKELGGRLGRDEFDAIGQTLANPWSNNLLHNSLFQDIAGRPFEGVEAETRRQVFVHFIKEGVLLERWALALPWYDRRSEDGALMRNSGSRRTFVDWDADGNCLERFWLFGEDWRDREEEPRSLGEYSVQFLTAEQKAALIGTPYARHLFFSESGLSNRDDGCRRDFLALAERQRKLPKHIIQPDDFRRILYRPREVCAPKLVARYEVWREERKRERAEKLAEEQRMVEKWNARVEQESKKEEKK